MKKLLFVTLLALLVPQAWAGNSPSNLPPVKDLVFADCGFRLADANVPSAKLSRAVVNIYKPHPLYNAQCEAIEEGSEIKLTHFDGGLKVGAIQKYAQDLDPQMDWQGFEGDDIYNALAMKAPNTLSLYRITPQGIIEITLKMKPGELNQDVALGLFDTNLKGFELPEYVVTYMDGSWRPVDWGGMAREGSRNADRNDGMAGDGAAVARHLGDEEEESGGKEQGEKQGKKQRPRLVGSAAFL